MKLSFLGRSYDASITEIETPKATSTVRFLGKAYHPHQPLAVQTSAKVQRRFRGIAY